MNGMSPENRKHRVVIIGAGFGGIACAKRLASREIELTVVDRRSHQEFQPLLFQVATGGLRPDAARYPICDLLPRDARFVHDAVTGIDTATQRVQTIGQALPYDSLVLAAGARVELPPDLPEALPLKDLTDANALREHLLDTLAQARAHRRASSACILVVGGGPTGVELAGEIAGLAASELEGSGISSRVLLVEQSERLLPGFSPAASRQATRALLEMGIDVHLGSTARQFATHRYRLTGPGETLDVEADTLVWAAGVRPSGLSRAFAPLDSDGRAVVDARCRVPSMQNVFVIGDAARLAPGPTDLPWTAAVATQQGVYVARAIRRSLRGKRVEPFRYIDKGQIAHVGPGEAVGQVLGIPLSGSVVWALAELVHLFYLPGVENRIIAAADFLGAQLARRRRPTQPAASERETVESTPAGRCSGAAPVGPTFH